MDQSTYDKLLSGELTIEQLRRRYPPKSPWQADALEAQLMEAEATIVLAMQVVAVDHPAWEVLDGYDGSLDSVRDLKAELAKVQGMLRSMTRLARRMALRKKAVLALCAEARTHDDGYGLVDPEYIEAIYASSWRPEGADGTW